MDPITILGAASSAIGIASFGLQLAQFLTKYASDASAAAQNLKATLTNIRAASASIEHINHLLKKEGERLKLGQKATLNAKGIREIQYINDECLKVFWRVEAWVLDKDDSDQLELKIANRLHDYKEDVRFNPGKDSQFLKVDEALAGVRKLRGSRFARYRYPLQSHKLDQYRRDLHILQGNLSLLFLVSNKSAEYQSESAFKSAVDAPPSYAIPNNFEQPMYLHPNSATIDAMNYRLNPMVGGFETQHLNSRLSQPAGRMQFIPVPSGIRYVANPYMQIQQSHVLQPQINRRGSPHFRKFIPPAVPDDPLSPSILRTDLEADKSYDNGQQSKGENLDNLQRKPQPSEHIIHSGNATLDAAKIHMANHDAKARPNPGITSNMDSCDTKIYPDYPTSVEKREETDDLSVMAVNSLKTFADVEHTELNRTPPNYYSEKMQFQKGKECEHPKTWKSTLSRPLKIPSSGSEESAPVLESQTVLHGYKSNLSQTSKVSRREMQMHNTDKKHTISDLRNELNIATPQFNHFQEARKPKLEVPLDPKPKVLASEYQENNNPPSNRNTSDNFADRSDTLATLRHPISEFIIDGASPSRKSDPQTVRFDLLSKDREETRIGVGEVLRKPNIPQVSLYDETPRAREISDERANIGTAKVHTTIPNFRTSGRQYAAGTNQGKNNIHKSSHVNEEDMHKETKNVERPEKLPGHNTSHEPQIEIISENPPADLPPSPRFQSLLNNRFQPNHNGESVESFNPGEHLNHDVHGATSSRASNSQKSPTADTLPCDNHISTNNIKTSEPPSIQSMGAGVPKFNSNKNGRLKRIFKRSHPPEDDLNRAVPTGAFLSTFFIMGYNYRQIPMDGSSRLRKPEIKRMLSQSPRQDWWKEFCFLGPAETDSLSRILRSQGNYRRELIRLEEVKKPSGKLWARGDKGHIAITIDKPLSHTDTAPTLGLEFRSVPARAASIDTGKNQDARLLGDFIIRAMEDRDCLYCAYTIHPAVSEVLYQFPDWVNAHIAIQHFSKRHILGRILELSTSGKTVIAKHLELTVLQQKQVQAIVDSKNEDCSSNVWTLAQLEVVHGQCLSPGSDGIQSITIYLVADANAKTGITTTVNGTGDSINSSGKIQDKCANNIQTTTHLKPVNLTTSLKSPLSEHLEPSTSDTKDTDSTFLNSSRSITAYTEPSDIEDSDTERMFANHYKSLHVPTNANAATIKKAYLSLYKTSYPLLNSTDPSAGKRFVAITEAYETLRNASTREAYDRKHNFNQHKLKRRPGSPERTVSPLVTEMGRADHKWREISSDDDSDRVRRSRLRSRFKASEPRDSDSNSSSGYESSPRQTHGVGRSPYRRLSQRTIVRRVYDDRPGSSLPKRNLSYAPSFESYSSHDDYRLSSPSIRRPSQYAPPIRPNIHADKFARRARPRSLSPSNDSPYDGMRSSSPRRTSLHDFHPLHAVTKRASASNGQPGRTSPRRTPQVDRASTRWQQRNQSNNSGVPPSFYSGAYDDWTQRSKKIQPPSPPPEHRPTSYSLPSHQFIQEPIIPFDRRPAYYPNHHDSRSYNPYAPSGEEPTGDHILQQLLLEWTPAGDEAEAAAEQVKKEKPYSNTNLDFKERLPLDLRNAAQDTHPGKVPNRGKAPLREHFNEAIENPSNPNSTAKAISQGNYYMPSDRRSPLRRYTSGPSPSPLNKSTASPTHGHNSSSKNTTLEVEKQNRDLPNNLQIPNQKGVVEKIKIPNSMNTDSKSGRRPMATVEDDAGDSPDFEKPSMPPRRATTTMF